LLAVLNLAPTPRLAQRSAHIADNRLAAGVNVNVLDADGLLATATQLRQDFHLNRVGSLELDCAITVSVELWDYFGAVDAAEQRHCGDVRRSHLHGKHCLNLVLRADGVDRGESRIEPAGCTGIL
jgi:hypothetical protein